jgi:hypothetical protein
MLNVTPFEKGGRGDLGYPSPAPAGEGPGVRALSKIKTLTGTRTTPPHYGPATRPT